MDACQFFLLRYQDVHSDATDLFLTGITDEQMRCCPVRVLIRLPGLSGIWLVPRISQ